MAEQLLPLADYSRLNAQVGAGGFYLFDGDGHKLNVEMFELSLQLRHAQALEAQQAARNAVVVELPADSISHLRQAVQEMGPNSPVITDWLFHDANCVEVRLTFQNPGSLFYLGRWLELTAYSEELDALGEDEREEVERG